MPKKHQHLHPVAPSPALSTHGCQKPKICGNLHRFTLLSYHGFDNIIGPSHLPRPLPCCHTLPVFINKWDDVLQEQRTFLWAPPRWHHHWREPSPRQPNLILGEHRFGVLILCPRLPREVGQSTKAHFLEIWKTKPPRATVTLGGKIRLLCTQRSPQETAKPPTFCPDSALPEPVTSPS